MKPDTYSFILLDLPFDYVDNLLNSLHRNLHRLGDGLSEPRLQDLIVFQPIALFDEEVFIKAEGSQHEFLDIGCREITGVERPCA
jgi:hypothetical protein